MWYEAKGSQVCPTPSEGNEYGELSDTIIHIYDKRYEILLVITNWEITFLKWYFSNIEHKKIIIINGKLK